ncbi:MAG TPA: acyl-CoA dehydrogenase family protein [Solirubrobacterales bacterium]|jgi:putative acyl-CoA dehydrogenase|nr:acyl-CoA dehydrogenase family protein [Solirubrobacterales bacterium]
MATRERQSFGNHEVANQPPPLADYNLFEADTTLREAVRREGAEWAESRITAVGAYAGSADAQELGRLANDNGPRLKTHDRYGNRVDEAEFHPAWHELLGVAVEHELHSSPWKDPRPGAHVARGAAFMCMSQAEAGIGCPISMTYSVIPALRTQPELAAEWEPRFLSPRYDPQNAPAPSKAGALAGMGMTEKQGGTDVRANTTVARPVDGGGPGAEYELSGHKWFMSAPMCDAFLVLAQADGGISCFLFPRWTPDGERNRFRLQRLKDKLGNRSNASSEVEFDAASAWLVGEEGAGVRTIIEMVNHTRLDCVIGGATGMRAGVAQAIHHASHRSVFGTVLSEQPLMANVLADLAIESEAATIGALRLARAYDEALAGDEDAANLKRVANAVLKYWICKRAPMHAGESLECLGGNGYVEESGMPRLFRESPLNSIWEGSGNVQCLDVLRAMIKSPASLEAFFAEVEEGATAEPRLAAYASALRDEVPGDVATIETRARHLVERMALALQGSLLVRYGDEAVADAFCASRLAGDWGQAFGTLPAGVDFTRIVDRHRAAV